MRLGSGTYKEIALDALKGNWVKAAVVGLFANWLGVFSSSFLFIAKYAFIAVILIYFLECTGWQRRKNLCPGYRTGRPASSGRPPR